MSDMRGAASGGPKPLATTSYRVLVGDVARSVSIVEREDGLYLSLDDGPEQRIDVTAHTADGELSVLVAGKMVRGLVSQRAHGGLTEDSVTVVVEGRTVSAVVQDARAALLASAAAHGRHHHAATAIRAPMPGLVVAVPVAVGEKVARGTTLVVLSAMKMQNELTAPAEGMVMEIAVSPGQTVDQNQVLVRLE